MTDTDFASLYLNSTPDTSPRLLRLVATAAERFTLRNNRQPDQEELETLFNRAKVVEMVENSGTSEGATKGWETRRGNHIDQDDQRKENNDVRALATEHFGENVDPEDETGYSSAGAWVSPKSTIEAMRKAHYAGMYGEGESELDKIAEVHLGHKTLSKAEQDESGRSRGSGRGWDAVRDHARLIRKAYQKGKGADDEELENAKLRGPCSGLQCERIENGAVAATPDSWYMLASVGEHPHAKAGLTQVVNDDSVQKMIENFNADAKDPNFIGKLVDFDHKTQSGENGEAAGWIVSVANGKEIGKKPGLWGRINWSDVGKAAVENRRYAWISPVWRRSDCRDISNDDGVKRCSPEKICEAAITNSPNFSDMVPLGK